ncbi:MAG: biopolymer transporter ExbD, partial [Deltaproteobacteria bacterium]|nr:biopolymer transporter ExbD [Deltaproteobacteria bacterium]
MAFETNKERNRPMSEINVTPLVDVMLVLLIIFMISASIESIQVQQEKERIELEIKKSEEELLNQKVPVNLPKTSSEVVNLAEERKIVLSMNGSLEFFIGESSILKCLEISPELKKHLKKPQ